MSHEERWLMYYDLAKEYYEEHGDLLIPRRYVVNDVDLGYWISKQRLLYKNKTLLEKRIELLEKIGMVWKINLTWEEMYTLAEKYYEEHGNLLVPQDYEVNGTNLRSWIGTQRKAYINNTLSKEKIKLLEKIGMTWKVQKTWEEIYHLAKKYYEEHGNLLVPRYYKIDGINLGYWIGTQRVAYKNKTLSKEKIILLEEIGMVWKVYSTWDEMYNLAKEYYEEHGNLLVPQNYEVNGVKLGIWLNNVRIEYRQGTLPQYRIKMLEKIEMVWNVYNTWCEMYALANEYYEKHGDLLIPINYEINGIKLGLWISKHRRLYKQGKLSEEIAILLERIDMAWDVRKYKFNHKEIDEENSAKVKAILLMYFESILENYKYDYILTSKKHVYKINNNMVSSLK